MKISTAQLKQIIKEEIQALTEMDEMMAFDYLEKEFGDKADLVMDLVYAAAEEFEGAAEEFEGRPSEEDLIDLFKEMGYGKDDEEPMDEALDPDASASYEAAMDQLDLVMKGMSVDQVLNVVKDYLEVGDLEMIIRKMPSAEAEEIFDTLRKMSK
jgi:hypothetical protein